MRRTGPGSKALRGWVICGIGIVCGFALPAKAQEEQRPTYDRRQAAAQMDYENWVSRYRAGSLRSYLGGEVGELSLAITAIEGDEPQLGDDQAVGHDYFQTYYYGVRVSTAGTVGRFYRSSMGTKGGGYPQLPAAEMKRLNQLLLQLPEDGASLPPPGRRLVMQVANGDHFRAHVYDRGNAPDVVLEILRLTRSGIHSWMPKLKPASHWKAAGHTRGGGLCLSPDGQQILSSSRHGPLKFWNRDSYELVKEVALPRNTSVESISLTPDGTLALIEDWQGLVVLDTQTWQQVRALTAPNQGDSWSRISSPRFTADGRFLIARGKAPALQFFDATSWERLKRLPGLPVDAVEYFPTSGTDRAIYRTADRTIALWDSKQQRKIDRLDRNALIDHVTFSPDKSLVATATRHRSRGDNWNFCRIRIWRADTGEFVRELRPFEQTICEEVEGLLWSPDGQYLLAATKSLSFFTSRGIDIWNVKSGRHRGEFSDCPSAVSGMILLGNDRLVANCDDGTLRVWDLATALKAIRAFEDSVATAKSDAGNPP